jgi:hypothetical protein
VFSFLKTAFAHKHLRKWRTPWIPFYTSTPTKSRVVCSSLLHQITPAPARRKRTVGSRPLHCERGQSNRRKPRAKDRPLANDFLPEKEFDRLLHAWFGNMARVLQPGGAFYLWGGYANCAN